MAKSEYRVCAVEGGSPSQLEEQTNAKLRILSDEGWRFVETIYAQQSVPLLLFKKQGKSPGKFGLDKPAGF